MSEENLIENEEIKEDSTNDANTFFDDIVNNLNLLKSFTLEIDKRLSKMEDLVEKMIEPLNDLKKIMLD
jgi:hypothetical protein